ncbi:MAG: hypothetical protein KGI51_10505 [Rhodospirillales bacterium]|nr:hypothetical protein [Rhodospirillales bacterium]
MADPSLSPEELARRRRGRNLALILVLAALSALFFAVSIVKLSHRPDLFTTSLDGAQGH